MATTSSTKPPEDVLTVLNDRVRVLESREAERTGMTASADAPKFNKEQYSINLGRPCTVIHRLGNGLLVTDIGPEQGGLMLHNFFATPVDFANHLLKRAATKELDK